MNIDHTNLLKALKREEPQPDISDAEKCRIAEEHHNWLKDSSDPSKEL